MLKRKAYRKIIITTFSIITLFIICIIPNKLSNINYLNPKINTVYVNNNNTISIYLLSNNNYLVKTNIIVSTNKLIDKVKEIINYLTINNSSKIPNGLSGIIPKETKLNKVLIEDKIVILDFSNNILKVSNILEERMIEAIVYSLIELDGVEGVSIKVDGNILNELPFSKKKLANILNRNYGINKVYEINDLNNVEKVVLYYIDNVYDNLYYVPVTKYLNDDREKIKIIIDNLVSNYIYESSLVSLLSNNTELISYEIEDKTMTLNFNDSIFNNDKLLEEVTYSISESVFESYDVDSVLFQVNGNNIEIFEKCCGIKNIK